MAQATYPIFVNATFTPWDSNPDYREALRTIPRAGDPTAYSEHPPGASATDVTTFKVG